MARFEELQQLWQDQSQPQPRIEASESRGMAGALRRFRRRQYVISGVKFVAIVGMIWVFVSRLGLSVGTILGEALVLAGMMNAMVTDWRIQSAIARLDFTRPSAGFIDAALERLRDPNATFRRAGWVGIGLVVAGANLMYARPSAAGSLPSRLATHAAITVLPCAAFALGLKVRAKRYAMEYKPLIERLAAMKAALNEDIQ